MKVAFYKNHRPGVAGLFDFLIRMVSGGPYSHCELVFSAGTAYSSSIQDGGCRFASIVFDPQKWDFIDLPLHPSTEQIVEGFCIDEKGCGYDFPGVFRFLVPCIPQSQTRWFCSEICVGALQACGMLAGVKAWQIHPSRLYELLHGR